MYKFIVENLHGVFEKRINLSLEFPKETPKLKTGGF